MAVGGFRVSVVPYNNASMGSFSLKHNRKLAYAISAALASAAQHAAFAADEETPSAGISEVVVTAQRRSESIQDVPITVQAISGDQLKQLNVVSFNDLMKYTPN